MLKKTMLLATVLIVSSCSKSPGGGGGSSVGSTIEAQFIDDPVKGLSYEAASNSSKTGNFGKFTCIKGEKVAFKLAGLALGETVCGEKIFVDDLVSDEADHSPEKVAAIIQSFAVAGSGELDLSQAVSGMSSTALAALSFTGNDATFAAALSNKVDDVKTAVPALAAVIDAKDPADMRTILDAAIAAYSNVSDAFKALLGLAAHAPSDTFSTIVSDDKMMTLTGKLISNDPTDECYDYVQARVSVSQAGSGAPFKFVVHRTASFDALDAYDDLTNLCKDSSWCDQGSEMPLPKLITSTSINFFSKMEESDQSGSWESETIAVLNASIQSSEFKISGTFQESGSYTDGNNSGTFACKYSVSSDDVAIPATGPMSDDDSEGDDVPPAAVGVWNRIVDSCTNTALLNVLDDSGTGVGGIKISLENMIDHILSNGEVGDVVGYSGSYFNNNNEWIISQAYTDGEFVATFVDASDFTFIISETSSGASCSGHFELQL